MPAGVTGAVTKEPTLTERIQQALVLPDAAEYLHQALLVWRDAKPNSAAERRAARNLAYNAALLLRALGVSDD